MTATLATGLFAAIWSADAVDDRFAAILAELKSTDVERREHAVDALARAERFPDKAAAAIVEATQDRDAGVREKAAMALVDLMSRNRTWTAANGKAMLAAAQEGLRDPHDRVRRAHLMVVGSVGSRSRPAAAVFVGVLLAEPDDRLRRIAAQWLGALRSDADIAAPGLLAALERDRSFEVRLEAVNSLGELTELRPGVDEALTKAARSDRSAVVRRRAEQVLQTVRSRRP